MSVTAALVLCIISFVLAFVLAGRRERPAASKASPAPGAVPLDTDPSIAPLLAQVGDRIAALETERARSTGMLVGQMRELRASGELLRSQAHGLERALRQPLGRGQWGELQLRRVVELAGMSEYCRDFATQVAARGADDERLRPDLVVNLPNGRCIVIDAKTPLDAYLDATAAESDEAAAPHLSRHAEQVATHVRQLSSKQYALHVDGALPDLVVLFLPAEHLFAAALRERADLIEWSYQRGVVIATPTTLLTMLHAVAQGWREDRLAASAEQIAALGRELHDRVATMANHFAMVGRRLDGAVDAYNKTVGTLERRVLPTARRFHELDAVGAGARIEPLAGTDERTRALTAPELLEHLHEPADVA